MAGKEQGHRRFVAGLTSGECLLVTLRDELYDGVWDRMLRDLKDRLEKRPYIFKLSSRIESDMAAIEKLSRYEEEHEINLRDFLGRTGDG